MNRTSITLSAMAALAVSVLAALALAVAGCAPQTDSPEGAGATAPPKMKMTTEIPGSILWTIRRDLK